MAVALPRVTRQQLKDREQEWFNSSNTQMSRTQGRPAEALQPVKYMLEQTCITLSKAEAKLSCGNMIEDGGGGGYGGGGGLPAIKGASGGYGGGGGGGGYGGGGGGGYGGGGGRY